MKCTKRHCRICLIALIFTFGTVICLPHAAWATCSAGVYSYYQGGTLYQKPSVGEPLFFNAYANGPYSWELSYCDPITSMCEINRKSSSQRWDFTPPYPGSWHWTMNAQDPTTGNNCQVTFNFTVTGTSPPAMNPAAKGGPQCNKYTIFGTPG